MKIKSLIIILVVAVCALGTFYLLNDEVFYREYWTQRKINEYKNLKSDIPVSKPNSLVRYKFYHNSGIDFTIELNNLGYLTIKTNDWHTGSTRSTKSKNLNFKIDKLKFKNLQDKFITNWSTSSYHDTDDHFGGVYYEVELVYLKNEKNNLKVSYYNIIPDQAFMDFKDELISISENELKQDSK